MRKASTKSTQYSDIPQRHSTGAEIRHWVNVDAPETLMKMQLQHSHYWGLSKCSVVADMTCKGLWWKCHEGLSALVYLLNWQRSGTNEESCLLLPDNKSRKQYLIDALRTFHFHALKNITIPCRAHDSIKTYKTYTSLPPSLLLFPFLSLQTIKHTCIALSIFSVAASSVQASNNTVSADKRPHHAEFTSCSWIFLSPSVGLYWSISPVNSYCK